jgi:spore coat protein A
MLIADRMFDTNGQLIFPDGSPVHNDEFPFGLNGPPPNPSIHPFWNPEFFGDVIVVNGKAWPKMTVKPVRYRFRILNGSNARFYNLKLAATRSSGGSESGQPGPGDDRKPVFWVIGTDGGLLDKPVKTSELLIAPSERYDVIIDFGKLSGYNIKVTNDANGPFPDGDPVDPDTNGKVMRFEVGHEHVADTSFDPAAHNARLRGQGQDMLPSIVRLVDGKGGLAQGVDLMKKRQLVLVEVEGPDGPNEVLLNNTKWSGRIHGTDGVVRGSIPVGAVNITELPVVRSTELWEIVNLTDDAHPIHIHLGQFQLMNRQAIDATGYVTAYNSAFDAGGFDQAAGPPNLYTELNDDGALGGNPAISPYLSGPVSPPKAYEFGWKDVWTMLPGTVTRIVVRIAPQDPAVNAVSPGQNLFAFDPTATLGSTDTFGYPGGPGYLWHCHILDHEDNEMMRPYIPVGLSESQ